MPIYLGNGHLTVRVPADGDLQPQWEGQGYTIKINDQVWHGMLTSVTLDGRELLLEMDLCQYPGTQKTAAAPPGGGTAAA